MASSGGFYLLLLLLLWCWFDSATLKYYLILLYPSHPTLCLSPTYPVLLSQHRADSKWKSWGHAEDEISNGIHPNAWYSAACSAFSVAITGNGKRSSLTCSDLIWLSVVLPGLSHLRPSTFNGWTWENTGIPSGTESISQPTSRKMGNGKTQSRASTPQRKLCASKSKRKTKTPWTYHVGDIREQP